MALGVATWTSQRHVCSLRRLPAGGAFVWTRAMEQAHLIGLSNSRPLHRQRSSLLHVPRSHQARRYHLLHSANRMPQSFSNLPIRTLNLCHPSPSCRRLLTVATILRHPDFHRTYFQRDSTPFTPSSPVSSPAPGVADDHSTYSAYYPWPQQQQQQHQYGGSGTTGGPFSSTLGSFLAGILLALPLGTLVSMYLLTAGYVPGWSAASRSELLEQIDEIEGALQEARDTISGLNAASYKVQHLLADLMTPSLGIKLVRDDALLAVNPPTLTSGHVLGSGGGGGGDALLLRAVDARGDTRALVLAFKKPAPQEQQQQQQQSAPTAPAFAGGAVRPAPPSSGADWQVEFAVSDWLEATSKQLHAQGRNAYPVVPLVVYTPDYFGVHKRGMEGFIWTRADSRDFPPGWPMRQLGEVTGPEDGNDG